MITLLKDKVVVNEDSIDLAYKCEGLEFANTSDVSYKIMLVRNGLDKEFTINYKTDKAMRDEDFEKFLDL